mmetsp:Transcript_33482/g.79017  ORF Transcript_33482/g.79017 Transcript_33482/m.79017 type:complete len:272 (+) Transcript_33482:2327-3142(+)
MQRQEGVLRRVCARGDGWPPALAAADVQDLRPCHVHFPGKQRDGGGRWGAVCDLPIGPDQTRAAHRWLQGTGPRDRDGSLLRISAQLLVDVVWVRPRGRNQLRRARARPRQRAVRLGRLVAARFPARVQREWTVLDPLLGAIDSGVARHASEFPALFALFRATHAACLARGHWGGNASEDEIVAVFFHAQGELLPDAVVRAHRGHRVHERVGPLLHFSRAKCGRRERSWGWDHVLRTQRPPACVSGHHRRHRQPVGSWDLWLRPKFLPRSH